MEFSGLPPLTALRAFEAAARNGNLSAAGRELNVTHAAVAQQVKRLEKWFGVSLLERSGRGVAPTARGVVLARGLSDGFTTIAETVRHLETEDQTRPLRITTTDTFASGWLLPRLAGFRRDHPDMELMVNPSAMVIDMLREDYDVAFRFGRGEWAGLDAVRMVASDVVMVATAEFVRQYKIVNPTDLARVPWVQDLNTDEIQSWLAAHNVPVTENRDVLNLPGNLMMDALRQGHGVGLTARAWVADDIAAGRMCTLFEEAQDPNLGYYLVHRPPPHRGPLKKFLRWVRKEIAAELEQVNSSTAMPAIET